MARPTEGAIQTGKGMGRLFGFAAKGMGKTGAYNPNFSGTIGQGLGKLEGMEINVSQKGLDNVKTHISTFNSYIPNQAMIQHTTIRKCFTEWQTSARSRCKFLYMHEVSEFTKMGKGMSYDTAHASAIEKYNVSHFKYTRSLSKPASSE
ncbi:hypothetical protein ACFOLF_37085 [Paenibacillus sepulcri]